MSDGDRKSSPPSRFGVLQGAADLLEVDDASVFAAFIPVQNEQARQLLVDPIELLRHEGVFDQFGIGEGWRVTVNRVDAEIPVHNPGPHHLLVIGLVLKALKQVHCTVHRSLRDRDS